MTSNLSLEERRDIFTRHIDAIDFVAPNASLDLGKLSFPAWRNELIESFVNDKKTKDPNSLLPSRSRLERMIRDKKAIAADPDVILDVPEGYKGTPASYKNSLKYDHDLNDGVLMEKYMPRGEGKNKEEWKQVVLGEKFWALFAENHLPGHFGRDKFFVSVGSKKYLPKKIIGNMILSCCSSCGGRTRRKRELPVEGDAVEGPAAKRRRASSIPSLKREIRLCSVGLPSGQLASPSSDLPASGPSNPDAGGTAINGEKWELFGGQSYDAPYVTISSTLLTSTLISDPTPILVPTANSSFGQLMTADEMDALFAKFDEDFFTR
ncbi:uncharacterized protein EAE98_009214 [Botrytis deweyae]|uniref:TEA domain-containing protein n=1 Tax=Botrytis deweyae TaxID=2478750 RepID=A0ABQ7ICU4_9HELO|nr:uncharacterized protein EAE98_009214 [Botrytis deweyae]KAF7919980.1 hypothetical protein EAE98_009214 [Botrytis deweyae]